MEIIDLVLRWSAVLLVQFGRILLFALEELPKLYAELKWVAQFTVRLCGLLLNEAYAVYPRVLAQLVALSKQGLQWFVTVSIDTINHAYTILPKLFAEILRQLWWSFQWFIRLYIKVLIEIYIALPIIYAEVSKQLGIVTRWCIQAYGNALNDAYRAYPKVLAEITKQFASFVQWSIELCGKVLSKAYTEAPKISEQLFEKFTWAFWQFESLFESILRWLLKVCVWIWYDLNTVLVALSKFIQKIIDVPLKTHPYTMLFIAILIALGPWILFIPYAIFYLILHLLGFGTIGIIGGSPAARYQSSTYGPNTPAGSIFALLQSTGMQYNVETTKNVVLAPIRVLAGLVAVYVLFRIIWA